MVIMVKLIRKNHRWGSLISRYSPYESPKTHTSTKKTHLSFNINISIIKLFNNKISTTGKKRNKILLCAVPYEGIYKAIPYLNSLFFMNETKASTSTLNNRCSFKM